MPRRGIGCSYWCSSPIFSSTVSRPSRSSTRACTGREGARNGYCAVPAGGGSAARAAATGETAPTAATATAVTTARARGAGGRRMRESSVRRCTSGLSKRFTTGPPCAAVDRRRVGDFSRYVQVKRFDDGSAARGVSRGGAVPGTVSGTGVGPREEDRQVVTIADVAREAGVSTSTVSYVLSGKRTISAATRARVQEASTRLGYRPNQRARALASSRSRVIALVVPLRPEVDVAVVMQFV